MGESVRIIKKFSKANFILKGSGKYEELSPKYVLRKAKIAPGKPILVVDGALRDSVIKDTADSIIEISEDNAIVGTEVDYSFWVQEGTKNKDGSVRMPARPYLALTIPIVDAIANTIEADVLNQLEDQISVI